MALSRFEQEQLQTEVDLATPEEIERIKKNADKFLFVFNMSFNDRKLNRQERHEAEIAIETLVRIECKQQDKGWWFRAKRRNQLFREHLLL